MNSDAAIEMHQAQEQLDGLPDHSQPLPDPQYGDSNFYSSGAPDAATSDDPSIIPTPDLDETPPFSIRGYVAAVRDINIAKCWPFSRKLLEESIREGKDPLLPPLSPCATVVHLSRHYFDSAGTAHEGVDEVFLTEGPQLQVQIDLSKCEPESEGQGGTLIVGMSASLEAGPLEREKPSEGNRSADICPTTSQEHKASSIKDVQMEPRPVTPFPENIFVFKRQAPRSIREIRERIMEGCQCFKRSDCLGCMQIAGGINGTLQMSMGNKMPILNSSIINIPAGTGDSRNKELAVHPNTSESTLLEDCRKECATINGLFVKKISHVGVDTIENIVSDFNLIEKVEDEIATMQASCIHKEFPMAESNVPLDLETEMQGNTVAAVALPSKRAGKLCEDTISKTCISDTQSVDNSLENFKSDSSNSMPCSDAITQQKCPVCLHFQSSSNTALNAHIDHCLASSDMERSKPKWQKAKVRKKRSIAELCSISPPCVLDELHDLDQNILPSTTLKEDTTSKIDMKQRPKILAIRKRQSTQGSCHRRRICTSRSRGKAFKFQWSKLNRIASRGHPRQTTGALKMVLHESRLHHVKRANSLGRTLNWNSKTMLRNSNNLKRKNDAPVSIADQEPEEMNQKYVEHFSNEFQGTPVNEKQKVPKLWRRRKGKANQNPDKEAVQDLTDFRQSELKKTLRKQLRKVNVKDQKAMSRSKLLKEKLPRNVSKQAAHLIGSDNLITVLGSHDATLETLEREANANDRHDQGSQLARKTQFCLHLKPAKKSKNKYQQNSAGSFDDSSNLQLAIIQYPSVPQRGLNEECMVEGVHSRETNLQVDTWLDYDSSRQQSEMDVRSSEQHLPVQPQLLSEKTMSNPSNVRILVEERSMQEPSLPMISSMSQGHFNEARGRNKVRDLEASLAECTAPSLLNRALPFSDNSLLAENLHCTNLPYRALHDVPQFPLDAQSKEALFLRNHSSEFTRQAWHSVGEAHRQVQVVDPQQAQESPLLSTALTDYNDILGQQHRGFSLSLCRKDANQWPGHCQERSLSMAGLEDLRPLVPVHLIKPLQITGLSKTTTASHMNRELTRANILTAPSGRHDKHLPAFHNAEIHQLNQGSTQSVLPKDHPSIQNPSVQTGSSVETRQAERLSRNLPPWMQAAIKDQRSVPFAQVEITGHPLNQSSVLGTSSPTNREMSGGSSVFDIVGKPVLRLMGKTMVLTPGPDQNQVDIGITHLNGQSNSGYMNLLQPTGPREHSFEQLKQWNSSQQQQAGYQAGFAQNRVSGEPIIRNREDRSWLSSGSCSQPQLRDLFSSAPSSQTAPYAFAKQHASFQLSGSFPTNVSGQEVFTHSSFSRGTPLYTSKFPDAYMRWQHQKLKGQSSFEPYSTAFCKCGYPASHGALCEGRRCNGYESILPQGHANAGNPAYSLLDVPNSMLQGPIQVNAHAVPPWLSNVNRNDKVHKPAEILIIDDEDDPIGSMPRLLGQELNLIPNFRPPLSAALHPLQHHNAGNIATVPGTCNPTRQNPKTKEFVPVIYTIRGKRAESRFMPSSVAGPKFQELSSEECREVENYGTVINPKKRISSSEQVARIGKFVKTSERGSPSNFSNRDGSPCDLVLRGWGEPGASAKQRPPVKALQPVIEQLQGEERRGKICTPEVFIPGNLSTQPLDKDSTQSPTSLNSSKASRIAPFSMGLHGPLVGICSTNMNPAEVDCQDASQFMSMPCLSSSKMVPPDNGDSGQQCIYINSGLSPSRLQSTVTMQEPGSSSSLPPTSLTVSMQKPGPSGLPPAISTATMQEPGPSLGLTTGRSMTHQFISKALDTFVLKSAGKGDDRLPVIYDSSKQYPWNPEKTGAKSSDISAANQSSLVSKGTQDTAAMSSHTRLNSRTQPGLESTTQSQGMKPFKVAGKFLIVNGRVSMLDMAKEKVAAVADGQYQEPRDHNRVSNGHQSFGKKVGNGSMTIRDSYDDLTTAVPNWHAISESL